MKIAIPPPPEKSHPIFPGNPPLKVEVLCYPRKFTVSTYIHQTLPNIKNVIDKHWHILSINENVRKVFDKRPFIAYRRNTSLYKLIGGNRICKIKVVSKNTN